MKFSFDSLLSAIIHSFSLKKNTIAFLHILAGLFILDALIYTGSQIGMAGSIGLGLLGFVFFYYILVRTYYFSTFFALDEIQNNEKNTYFSAKSSFKNLKWSALFAPIVFILFLFTIALIELLIMSLISHIPAAGTVIQAFLTLPFFIFNFLLVTGTFIGFNLCFSAIIDQRKETIQTMKITFQIRKKRFYSLFIYRIISGFFTLLVALTFLFIASLTLLAASAPMTQNFLSILSLKSTLYLLTQSSTLSLVILCVYGTAIIAFFLAYLLNVSARVNASLYLAAKEGIEINEKIHFKFWKRKV